MSGIVFHWDWGQSPTGGSVNEEVSRRIWFSLRLIIAGELIGIVVGVAIGAWTATRSTKVSDRFFTGATFMEIIFSFHGMGEYGVTTILGQDVNRAVAVTAFSGVCVLVGAILADLMVAVLDPRVRFS